MIPPFIEEMKLLLDTDEHLTGDVISVLKLGERLRCKLEKWSITVTCAEKVKNIEFIYLLMSVVHVCVCVCV